MTTADAHAGDLAPIQVWILQPEAPSSVRIWGLTPEERLRRTLARAGCTDVRTLHAPDPSEAPASGSLLLLCGDVIFDERLVTGLRENPGVALLAPPGSGLSGVVAAHTDAAHVPAVLAWLRAGEGPGATGLREVTPEEIAPSYVAALRKSEPPVVLAARPDRVRQIEDRLFSASYKGKTDLVTKWLWPVPAAEATRWAARVGLHPNVVTAASWVLAIAAALLFWKGFFGTGLLAAWLMTFLDTVDGKLARVTMTSSRVGHVMDHGLDIVHPPFWYLAWGLGIGPAHALATAVVVLGYVVGRLLEGVFILAFGIETHSWRSIDSLFRTITARRNPNLIFLTVGTLGGRPDLGMVMVALWTGASLLFHTVRLCQAFLARARGDAIVPWDEDPAPAERPTARIETRDRSAA